ncbi:MAG: DNA polymerase III subunit chi [Alphaproteobacteria bacterium]
MSTEVRFYHLERQSEQQVLPMLLSKAMERGHKIVVKFPDDGALSRMDDYLWAYSEGSFLPHGSAKTGKAEAQPIWLTTEDENPNGADVLISCSGALSEMHGDYGLCCEMLNGQDAEAVSAARARWKIYKDKGYDVTYWQQDERGAWAKKA